MELPTYPPPNSFLATDPHAATAAHKIQEAITNGQDLFIEVTIRQGEVTSLSFAIPDPEHRPQLP